MSITERLCDDMCERELQAIPLDDFLSALVVLCPFIKTYDPPVIAKPAVEPEPALDRDMVVITEPPVEYEMVGCHDLPVMPHWSAMRFWAANEP
jgi:hypothetical protein